MDSKGIKLGPPALGEWSISHWTTREVPGRLVRVSWKARRSNLSVKEINPNYSLERLMLKLQYFGYLIGRANSLEKTPMLEKLRAERKEGDKWLDDITDAMDINLGKLQEMVRDREAWCATVHGVMKSWS